VMNRGRVEQVGSAAEIYARPATAFVADFVGEMNMLEGVVSGPGRVQVGALALECPVLGARSQGERVRLGLRPEEVRIRGVDAAAANAVAVEVELLDFLGAFCRATLRVEAARDLALLCDFSA